MADARDSHMYRRVENVALFKKLIGNRNPSISHLSLLVMCSVACTISHILQIHCQPYWLKLTGFMLGYVWDILCGHESYWTTMDHFFSLMVL